LKNGYGIYEWGYPHRHVWPDGQGNSKLLTGWVWFSRKVLPALYCLCSNWRLTDHATMSVFIYIVVTTVVSTIVYETICLRGTAYEGPDI